MIKPDRYAFFMVPPLNQGGGAEKYFISLAHYIASNHKITEIITLDKKFFKIFARILYIIVNGNFFGKINLDGREAEAQVKKILFPSLWLPTSLFSLKNILAKYSVIYTKNEIIELLILKFFGSLKSSKIIIGVHTPFIFNDPQTSWQKFHNILYNSLFYRWLIPSKAIFHSPNQSSHQFVLNKLHRPSQLIPYPFSLKESQQLIKLPPNLKFSKNIVHFAFIGRLSDQKGQDILLKLIERLATNKFTPSFQLNVFGSGDLITENRLSIFAKTFSWLKWYGHIENKYIYSVIKKQRFIISPSRWDVLPYNILEAQALGIPVLALNYPGAQDIIINNKTGLLVNNIPQYFATVQDWLQSPPYFNPDVITNHIKKKFNANTINNQMLQLFEQK